MKTLEFVAAFHSELQSLIFPKCNLAEQVAVGLFLGMLDYKIGKMVAENSDMAHKLGLIDADGNIDLECVEHALETGLTWPMKAGPFTFEVDDAKKIVASIRGREKK